MAKAIFNVLTWDFNTDTIHHYDILPYFRNCYKARKKRQKLKYVEKMVKESPEMKQKYGLPSTRSEFKEFVKDEALHMFWGRCEWELMCHGWPVKKQDYKLDVYEQIMMNIDIISEILWNEYRTKKKKK